MTAEEWDVRYWLIKRNLVEDGVGDALEFLADKEMREQFGPRPGEGTP